MSLRNKLLGIGTGLGLAFASGCASRLGCIYDVETSKTYDFNGKEVLVGEDFGITYIAGYKGKELDASGEERYVRIKRMTSEEMKKFLEIYPELSQKAIAYNTRK